MGSLDRYCRLCSLMVRQDHLLKLFDDNRVETQNTGKLRHFLNFVISPVDRLPKHVCVTCISNLDYCIQFVDKCRRIDGLLQRGLDVDYVATEISYRYSYLFPTPYPGQESSRNTTNYPVTETSRNATNYPVTESSRNATNYPVTESSRNTTNYPEQTPANFFGQVPARPEDNSGLNLTQLNTQSRPEHHDHSQQSLQQSQQHAGMGDNSNAMYRQPVQPQQRQAYQEIKQEQQQMPQQHQQHQQQQQQRPQQQQTQPQHQQPQAQQQPETQPTANINQPKVPMYRNNVSVDNMVVEIEPTDFFQENGGRKSGNVKPEYPWKVGGVTRKALAAKDKKDNSVQVSPPKADPESDAETNKDSPGKKIRKILPKVELGSSPIVKAGTAATAPMMNMKNVNQIMIPVTLKTPCRNCNMTIVAASLAELKKHVCPAKDQSVECPIRGCGRKFSSKSSLKYHHKHYHNQLKKEEVDIMSLATNELTGGVVDTGDRNEVNGANTSNCVLQVLTPKQNQKSESQEIASDARYDQVFQENQPPVSLSNSTNPITTGGQVSQIPPPLTTGQGTTVRGAVSCTKPYACPYQGCTKAYNAKTYLIQHERLHTGERPFSCKHCGKGFSRILDMKKHNLLKVCL